MEQQQEKTGGLIVFGDDGSPPADTVWQWINNHAWPAWRVEVVTATEPPLVPTSPDTEPPLSEWEPPNPRVPSADAGLAEVKHLTAPGDPRILLGSRSDADLLVVGTRGLNPFQSLLVGSTTEWLLHHPPAPMAVIRLQDRTQRVVIGVDGSPHSVKAMSTFTSLPWAAETEVVLVAVADGRTDVDAALDQAMEIMSGAGVAATPRRLKGRPTPALIDAITEARPQLAVIGSRGLTGLSRLTVGSTAGSVVRHAGCSVLVDAAD